MVSIPHLFVDTEQVFSTKDWYQVLDKSRTRYERCFVKSVTHVKNLGSTVSHEYLQVIIEDEDTSYRTRIIAERQTKQDQVIIGKWKASKWPSSSSSGGLSRFSLGSSSSSSSSSGSGEAKAVLPLPLASLKFDDDIKFKVVDLAKILSKTTDLHPKYNLLRGWHCYWFCRTVYASIKAIWPHSFDKLWKFSWLRGLLTPPATEFKVTADEFKAACEENMQYQPTTSGSALRVFTAVIEETHSPEFKDCVGDEWSIFAVEIPASDITEIEAARRNFEESVNEVCESILSMPSYDLGIATFEASKPEVSEASLDLFEEVKDLDLLPSGYTVVAPPSEQQDRLHRALKASVGSILFAMTPCPDAPCATMLPPHQSSHNCQLSDSLELAVAKRWIWETGQTIRVRFLNGTPDVHEKVRKWGTQWLEYANLRMDFVDESDTDPVDIRISFDKDKPTRSCIGTLCRGVAQDEATMNFDDPAAAEFEGVVLHEFGHALGCIHEHQSPAGGISWDKPFLYGYYSIMCELTKADVDNNILYRYTDADIKEMNLQNSSFDRQSVMMYEIKPRMTTDNMTVERCQKLSAWDKHFIAAAYPPKTIGKENVNVLDDRGGFPLYWAAAGGHLDDVEDLLDNRGADVNLRTEFDWTALHWAAGNGHVAVVRHLLLYGARVNVFSDTNKTPLDLARINGNSEIIKLLEKAAEKQAKAEVPAHGPVV